MVVENYKCNSCGHRFYISSNNINLMCSNCGSTEKTIQRFICIRKDDMKGFEIAVNEYLDAGYEICGGVCRSEDEHNVFYVVGMIKKN